MNKTDENKVIHQALQILKGRIHEPNVFISNPHDVRDYLTLKMGQLEHEVFALLTLNTKYGIIKYTELFRGTLAGANVYPREVMKQVLKENAHSVIFAHNHPSGVAEPSEADRAITTKLKVALNYIDVQVLDHFIVGTSIYSFSENGQL